MALYVIRRGCDGMFVAASGSRGSYTANILNAQKFTSKEAAEKDCCGNEYAVAVDSLLR